MKIAIVGCSHGELDNIYNKAQRIEQERGMKIDLMICCGDFQSTRNEGDLRCMAVPPKYYNLGSFYKYYSGEKEAPFLTIFIGGNHEASNYLQELPYGGWVAPKIYYLGYAGVVNFGGIRIGGLSGIFKPCDYLKGHHEKAPYTEDTKRSVYHVRNIEVFRLKQLSNTLDVMLSHDWPREVYNYGSIDELLRNKPFFEKEVNENKLGSKPCEELLFHLKPTHWFAAHLHTKFCATIPHLDEEGITQSETNFMALDKCLPHRKWIEIVDIPHTDESRILSYDLEWLTILYLTDNLMSSKKTSQFMPGPKSDERFNFIPSEEEKEFVQQRMCNNLLIPENFLMTAPYFERPTHGRILQPKAVINPQTVSLCEKLGIRDPLAGQIDITNMDIYSPTFKGTSTTERFSSNDSTYVSFDSSDIQDISFQSNDSAINSFTASSPVTNDSFKKPKLSFPPVNRFPNDMNETNDSDGFLFQIDRQGESTEIPPSPLARKEFRRRNSSLYTNQN